MRNRRAIYTHHIDTRHQHLDNTGQTTQASRHQTSASRHQSRQHGLVDTRHQRLDNTGQTSVQTTQARHDHLDNTGYTPDITIWTTQATTGSVVQWLGRWTRDGQVVSSTPMQPLHCRSTTLGKLFTPMCLWSPNSIIWYLVRVYMLRRCLQLPCMGPMIKGGIVEAVPQ